MDVFANPAQGRVRQNLHGHIKERYPALVVQVLRVPEDILDERDENPVSTTLAWPSPEAAIEIDQERTTLRVERSRNLWRHAVTATRRARPQAVQARRSLGRRRQAGQ